MILITWNCNGAFRRKFDSIKGFDADIYVIQECENPETSKDSDYIKWADNYIWVGENKNKGLGIFAKSHISLINNNWATNNLKYFISCKVNNDFDLIGAWCHGANSPTFGYIGQFWKYMQLHKQHFTNCIIAGDFNSNKIWDKWDRWWNHSDVVRELEEINVKSFYHHTHKVEQGEEKLPTFFLQRNTDKPYHIDYFFGSAKYLNKIETLEIGDQNKWLQISDHLPLIWKIKV